MDCSGSYSDRQDSSPCLIWDLSDQSPLSSTRRSSGTNYGQPTSIFLVTLCSDGAIGNFSLKENLLHVCFENGIVRRQPEGNRLFGRFGKLSVKRLQTGELPAVLQLQTLYNLLVNFFLPFFCIFPVIFRLIMVNFTQKICITANRKCKLEIQEF